MKAMLLAAGRGERMGPLTSDLPKPLLSLGPETLLGRHLRRLAAAGFGEIVINLSYRGGQIRAAIGHRTPWGQTVAYSEEGEPPLETAGGIVHALPLLGDEPFVAVSTDVVTDFDFRALRAVGAELERGPGLERGAEFERGVDLKREADFERGVNRERTAGLERLSSPERGAGFERESGPARAVEATGYLVLVPNPPHHPDGDFGLTGDGRLQMPQDGPRAPVAPGTPVAPSTPVASGGQRRIPESAPGSAPPRYTFGGIAVFHPALFRSLAPGVRPLRDVLFPAARRGVLAGEVFEGLWRDVGTPERLADARALISEIPHPNGGAPRLRTSREGAPRPRSSLEGARGPRASPKEGDR